MRSFLSLFLLLFFVSVNGYSLTYEECSGFMNRRFNEPDSSDIILQGADSLISPNTNLGDNITSPNYSSYFFFADLEPGTNWAHSARYYFVNSADTAVIDSANVIFPPDIELEPTLIYPIYTKSNTLPEFSNDLTSEPDTASNVKVLLYVGKTNKWGIGSANRYGNNVYWAYYVLTHTYNIPEENFVFLLPADYEIEAIVEEDTVLYNWNYIDSVGSKLFVNTSRDSMNAAFSYLDSISDENDDLLLYLNNHGAIDTLTDRTYLANHWGKFYDDTLAIKVNELEYNSINIIIECCHSGGFIDDIEDNCSDYMIVTACTEDEEGHYWKDQSFGIVFDIFSYAYWSILNYGTFPLTMSNSIPENFDKNLDSIISFHESYSFVDKDSKVWSYKPQGIVSSSGEQNAQFSSDFLPTYPAGVGGELHKSISISSDTINVNHSIIISSEDTLSVGSNTNFKIKPEQEIYASDTSKLIINADTSSKAVFECTDSGSTWKGFKGSGSSKLSIYGSIIKNADYGIKGTFSDLYVSRDSFIYCGEGIRITNTNNYEISKSTFIGSSSSDYGIYLINSSDEVFKCLIKNFDIGINIYSSSPTVYMNLIEDNRDIGISASGKYTYPVLKPAMMLRETAYNSIIDNGISSSHSNKSQIYIGNFANMNINEAHNNVYSSSTGTPSAPCIKKYFISYPQFQAKENYWGEDPDTTFFSPQYSWIDFTDYYDDPIPVTYTIGKDGNNEYIIYPLSEARQLYSEMKYEQALDLFLNAVQTYSDSNLGYEALSYLPRLFKMLNKNYQELIEFIDNLIETGWSRTKYLDELKFNVYLIYDKYANAVTLNNQLLENSETEIERMYHKLNSYIISTLTSNKSEEKYLDNSISEISKKMLVLNSENEDTYEEKSFSLSTYPNPFNPDVSIKLYIPEKTQLEINIYNIRGQLVKTIFSDEIEEGHHEFLWNGKTNTGNMVSTGIYLLKCVSGNEQYYKKMLMIK